MKTDLFSLNGKILPIEKAVVPASYVEYQYGFGVYETIRVQREVPYFLDQHVERLIASAGIIGLEHRFSADDVRTYVRELVVRLGDATYNLKLLLIGAKKPESANLYILPLAPLFPEKAMYRDGVSAITVRYERPFPNAKTLSMLSSYLAYRRAVDAGCYDALAVDRSGCITEGTRTNFFVIKERTIYTPPKETCLEGVTKQIVLGLAQRDGYRVEEKTIKPSDLPTYDGAFLTSTSSGVIPVRIVDEFSYAGVPASIASIVTLYGEFWNKCGGVVQ